MKVKAALFLGIFSLLLLFTPVLAVDSPSPTPSPKPGFRLGVVNKPATSEAKLRACQARESAIKKRMESLIKLVANMESKFDSIATRVQTFYTTKVVPSGKTLPNYDDLVLDIATKKTAVTNALNKAQTDVNSFNCTTGDPKAIFNQFRLDMQDVKKALKDYRTSIRNLIVAVHSLGGGESPSPTPTATPTATP